MTIKRLGSANLILIVFIAPRGVSIKYTIILVHPLPPFSLACPLVDCFGLVILFSLHNRSR